MYTSGNWSILLRLSSNYGETYYQNRAILRVKNAEIIAISSLQESENGSIKADCVQNPPSLFRHLFCVKIWKDFHTCECL